MNAMERLVSVASDAIGGGVHEERGRVLHRWGAVGGELAKLLAMKDGFYAFESALLVRPLSPCAAPRDLLQWNEPSLWISEFQQPMEGLLFFAEDAFGYQFALCKGVVLRFDPESGQTEEIARCLEEWCEKLLADFNYLTGYPVAHDWQQAHGRLPRGRRIVPIVPFVASEASYSLDNLYVLDELEGMQRRASLANQLRDVPDGGRFVFKIVDKTRPEDRPRRIAR